MNYTVKEGDYNYLGIESTDSGLIFTFEADRNAECSIVILDENMKKSSEIEVPASCCIGNWHSVLVEGLKADNLSYYYKINGELIVDPYATAIVGRESWNDVSRDKKAFAVAASYEKDYFDWGEDIRPSLSKEQLSIYKLNVRAFSMDITNSKKTAGTFKAVEDKLSYIKEVGFSAVELMPVYEFEEVIFDDNNKAVNLNMWGYGKGNYFAVKASYGTSPKLAARELKELIKSLHSMGMEVIMEIYFDEHTKAAFMLEVVKYWVKRYHVDGFHVIGDNLLLDSIYSDSFLSGTKIFYKNTDSYWAGERSANSIFAYNDEYANIAKSILNHYDLPMRAFVNQQKKQGDNFGFVNYFSNVDGFTLADLFMYKNKHNEDNGENNTDGNNYNLSNNYGVEGPSRKKNIKKIRDMKWKNAIIMLAMGQGIPMLMAGDEMDNSQKGNNNSYCQDNKTGWVNWKKDKSAKDKVEFVKFIMNFRRLHSFISKSSPFRFASYDAANYPDISYHGYQTWISEAELDRECIGIMYSGEYAKTSDNDDFVYVGYNFFSGRNLLGLPQLPDNKKWYLVCDSSWENDWIKEKPILLENQELLQMEPQAVSILVGR